jgi:crotonobetainyl-CoA:carnitine CoA-transferase CaiB-like acyl-CoA transferase
MSKFGLDYDSVCRINPKTIYCSITGYGQHGPLRRKAGHDINYLGDTGLLALSCGKPGARVLPQIAIADLAGGTYPAVINILMALRQRDMSGEGCRIDVSMTDSLFPLMYFPWAIGFACGEWPANGQERMTGASPRYNLYDTRDDGVLVVAAIEDKFWNTFASAIALDPVLADDTRDPAATLARIREIILQKDSNHWHAVFDGIDCCCTIMRDLSAAVKEPHFSARLQLERYSHGCDNAAIPALPIPLTSAFVNPQENVPAPVLGSSNAEFGLPSGDVATENSFSPPRIPE